MIDRGILIKCIHRPRDYLHPDIIMETISLLCFPSNSKLLLLFLLILSTSAGEEQKNITFQLQSSMTGIPDLSGLVPGIDVALDLINENSTVLPDYHLRYKDIVDAQVRVCILYISVDTLVSRTPIYFYCSVLIREVVRGELEHRGNLESTRSRALQS